LNGRPMLLRARKDMREVRKTIIQRGTLGVMAALLVVLSLAWTSPQQQTEPAARQ